MEELLLDGALSRESKVVASIVEASVGEELAAICIVPVSRLLHVCDVGHLCGPWALKSVLGSASQAACFRRWYQAVAADAAREPQVRCEVGSAA
jgi:hypothetical protein